ncbi:hypothetical protein TNIN_186061 [Trichonephila inaurata madagascariensis]|uniref:Lipase domain-containing protein n=1 Tax=Trichonephila inaurata madagascariensis TaxID=2747483 RepID=A0A8X6XG55_9ARAC|nr:hypothetical protein TNIN_186061 [Trichonephila inaurata madagascariensis]
MKAVISITVTAVITSMMLSEIGTQDLAQLDSGLIGILKYVAAGIKDDIQALFNPPKNRNDSIQYLLFTPDNPNDVQYIQPTEVFDQSSFNPSYETKVLIHGYETRLKPGNIFEKIKDEMLATDQYNVIIVNWIRYAIPPYPLGVFNTMIVGLDPAGPLYEIPQTFNRLYYTDAEYVDIIHTSNHLTG